MSSNVMTESCPRPLTQFDRVQLAHGAGGRLSRDLFEAVFLPAFANDRLRARHDGAVFRVPYAGGLAPRIAFTTDSYVVRPLFFPGGDIGSLAVNGSVNDLAMCGARPLVLSVGFVIEEGLAMASLERITRSMARAAEDAGVEIVTGDTKVVDKGKGDGIFVNTSGVGVLEHARCIQPSSVRVGDVILLTGDLGRHGVAILSARESLGFETELVSDNAPLVAPVLDLLDAGVEVHCLRDLTRGGLGAALVEISEASRHGLEIEEAAIPVCEDVAGACELLGLDPLYVANEGRFVAFVSAPEAERALAILRRHPVSADVRVIGRVADQGPALVTMKTRLGSARIVDLPSGELLPRIC
jgi:hydrogenase expression/formation protein HypE